MKSYYGLVVCGTGMGSSMILKVMAEQVISQNKLPIRLDSDVLSAARSSQADFFICTADLQPALAPLQRPVIGIKNMLDKQHILEALQAQVVAFEKEGAA